jgi:Flp pilus assembly protein protease CpaA
MPPEWVSIGAVVVAFGVASAAAISDVRRYRIPNWLTWPAAFLGLVYHAVFAGWPGVGAAMLGCLIGYSLLLIPYLLGGFGGGDVKLLGAVGAWLGGPLLVLTFLVSSVLLGLVSVLLIVRSAPARISAINACRIFWMQMCALGQHLGADERVEAVVHHENRRERLVPFGGVFAIGLLVAVLMLLRIR